MPWQFSFRKAAASAVAGWRKKRVDRRALDEPAVVEEQDLVAEAPRLAEVVRDHHDLGAGGVDRRDHRLDLARRAAGRGSPSARRGTAPRARASRRGPARGAAARRRRARAPAGRRGRRGRRASSATQRALLALAPRHAGELQREAQVAQHRAAQQHRPLEHHRLPARRARDLRRVPAHRARRSARSGRGRGAAARSCPRRWRRGSRVRAPGSSVEVDAVEDARGRRRRTTRRRARSGSSGALSHGVAARRSLTRCAPTLSASTMRQQHDAQPQRQRQVALRWSRARSPSSSRA